MTLRGSIGAVTALAFVACAPSPSSTVPSAPAALPAPSALSASRAASSPSLAPHAVDPAFDWEHAARSSYDGSLGAPGLAALHGFNDHEAWIDFTGGASTPFEAIVDLDTGCVTESGPRDPLDRLNLRDESDYVRVFQDPLSRALVAARLARVARFDVVSLASVMARAHTDERVAISDDHRTIAVHLGDRLYVSVDGGVTYTQVGQGVLSNFEVVHLADGGKTLLFYAADSEALRRHQDHATLSALDTGHLDAPVGKIALTDLEPLRVNAPSGHALFFSRKDQCFRELASPSAPVELTKTHCLRIPGALPNSGGVSVSPNGEHAVFMDGDFATTRAFALRIDGTGGMRRLPGQNDLHSISYGPDDEGRFEWEAKLGRFRIVGPEGVKDVHLSETPLGFGPKGSLILFKQPPLVRPHEPGQMIPPAKGTLDDVKCTLVRRLLP